MGNPTLRSLSIAIIPVLAVYIDMIAGRALCDEVKATKPPVLLQFVEAAPVASDGTLLKETGIVTARLHIDRDGRVSEVEIVDSTDAVFIEPATAAMLRFVFAPATMGEEPVASVALYRYRFQATAIDKSDPRRPLKETIPLNPYEQSSISPNVDKKETPYESVIRAHKIYTSMETRHQIEVEQIGRIPGIHSDAVLAVQTLPGVGKPPAMMGALFIRGSDDEDSLTLVDSLPVPTIFHFGAVNTIINSDMIDSVSYIPGNFPVRYGPGTGGVVDIHTRPPKTDRFHAYLDMDLWDAAVFAEGPLSKHWSGSISFRRSYIDGILKATGLMENQLQFTVAPRYYDFQVKAEYRPNAKDELSLFVFGSDDRVEFGGGISSDLTYLSTEIFTKTYFYMAGATWRHKFHQGMENELGFRSGFVNLTGNGAMSSSQRRSIPFHFRDELKVTLTPNLMLTLGTDSGFGRHKIDVHSAYFGTDVTNTKFEEHPGTYIELLLSAIPKTELAYGLRADYDSLTGNWGLDPRLEARYTPFRLTVLKAAFGLFHQPPPIYQSLEDDAPKNSKSMAAIHYSIGVEQTIPKYELLSLYLGGFYKDLHNTSFSHWGSGRAYGFELLLRHRPSRYFFGWVSYTLMKSERQDSDSSHFVPFDFDQTHVLTVVAGVSFPHEVGMGLRFRLASGLPYTPVLGTKLYDDWFAMEMPVWGETNSARMPMFHQLDFRVDKTFSWKKIRLSIYLDVQNVYNRQNAVLYIYSDDYSHKQAVYDLPVLPSLGLKVEY